MLPADAKIMSADDHLIEPPHLWVDRIDPAVPRPCPAHRPGRRARRLVVRGRDHPHPHGVVPAA